ncbi:hypothetical protein H0E84_11930 [Luteimonas sp. SJ-92]|uniref:Uncharacterized protein n=1 Tax=Luteimonas salinisoli TaxID=2752307 RepID=A0A853JF17_9GAMM|nr:hypothetical protein [Luteimonas salinisoli]NZA27088.1 hypothetical protein [Luteimonas salinisoli]
MQATPTAIVLACAWWCVTQLGGWTLEARVSPDDPRLCLYRADAPASRYCLDPGAIRRFVPPAGERAATGPLAQTSSRFQSP